jgi:hypothetical protein
MDDEFQNGAGPDELETFNNYNRSEWSFSGRNEVRMFKDVSTT